MKANNNWNGLAIQTSVAVGKKKMELEDQLEINNNVKMFSGYIFSLEILKVTFSHSF